MAAQLIDEEELLNNQNQTDDQITDETSQVEATPPVEAKEPEEEELPEKYRGKTLAQIAKMHQEAEKLIGRQANEVHEVRSLADQLLKQQLEASNKKTTAIEESQDEEDFFADPKQSIARTVEKHPAVLEAKQAALEIKKMKTAQQLASKHPDFQTIAADAGFQDWVKASHIRLNLFAKADAEYDFDSADELLSTYKEIKQIKAQQAANTAAQTQAVESKAQTAAMKAATVDVGGSGEVSKKVYRRADLIKLRMTDPDRYMQLEGEIMAAYAEGRVK